MKAGIFINGLLQMLDLIGQDLDVFVEVIIDDEVKLIPLSNVKAGTKECGIILSTIRESKGRDINPNSVEAQGRPPY